MFSDDDLKRLKELGTFLTDQGLPALLARLEAGERVNELRKKLDTFQMDSPEWNQAVSELEEAEEIWRRAAGHD